MQHYDPDKVFAQHKKQIAEMLKKSTPIQPHAKVTITEDQIKAQIAKGFVPTQNTLQKDRILCLNCGNMMRSNTTQLSQNSTCSRCHHQFTI